MYIIARSLLPTLLHYTLTIKYINKQNKNKIKIKISI